MARFNYSECLETGVTAMAPVFLLQMPLSVRTKEKETNSQLNLISRRLSSPISLAPMNGPRIALLSLCLSVCVCVEMALLQLSDIQQGSLTNRLDVVLKKNLAFWLAMLFSSSLGFVIIFPAAAMSDCLGQNRVHWQMQSRQFSYSFIHSFIPSFDFSFISFDLLFLSEKLHFSSIAEKMGIFRVPTTQPQQRRFDKSHSGCSGPMHVAHMYVSFDQQRPER